MNAWFLNLKLKRAETKVKRAEEWKRKEKIWKISIGQSYLWVTQPHRYFDHSLWNEWAKIQVKILYKIKEKLPGTHTYIRFSTYFQEQYIGLLTTLPIEEIHSKTRDTKTYLFPDCQDTQVWERLLLGPSMTGSSAKSIYMLDGTPSDWREIISEVFKSVDDAKNLNLIDMNVWPFSMCRCLCFMYDENFLYKKIDLSEPEILTIIEDIASQEGFELVITRE